MNLEEAIASGLYSDAVPGGRKETRQGHAYGIGVDGKVSERKPTVARGGRPCKKTFVLVKELDRRAHLRDPGGIHHRSQQITCDGKKWVRCLQPVGHCEQAGKQEQRTGF